MRSLLYQTDNLRDLQGIPLIHFFFTMNFKVTVSNTKQNGANI